MTLDLSYMAEQPSEAQEDAVRQAVETECIRAISSYLVEVADAMDANGIESIGSVALRAMAEQFTHRINNDENESDQD